jgi:hypothetical protein
MSERVTIQEKFTSPCEKFPNGRWERKIGDGDWEDLLKPGEVLPVVFFDPRISQATQTSEVPAEYAPMTSEAKSAEATNEENSKKQSGDPL